MQILQEQQFYGMSSGRNFLPAHPKIVKIVSQKSDISVRNSRINKSLQFDPDTIESLLHSQKSQILSLHSQLESLTQKNTLMQTSLAFYNNDEQKESLLEQIEQARNQQQDIMVKIGNCEKVGEATTPQEYYLWQKKKKVDQYERKLEAIVRENKEERENLREVCRKYRGRIGEAKEEIQGILREIETVQNEFKTEDSVQDIEVIDREKMNFVKEEYEGLKSTLSILRQNNEILSSQLEDGIQSIELTLRKSFENSRSTLIRELQSIKKEIESSEPLSGQEKGKQISSADAINQYVNRLNQIQQLLSKEEAEEASKIIKPFDWTTLKWEQYLDSQGEPDTVNYMQKFESLSKEHEMYQKQIKNLEKQIQQAINESVKLTQQNMQIESATNKLVKILQFIKK